MSVSRLLAIAAVSIVLPLTSALAQPSPAASAASGAQASDAKPAGCANVMARHDHGAEKGMPMARSAACAGSPASAAKAKSQRRHDHAKEHKQG